MILSKLADAIREQNWFTVVLEILIVVIGIFIGLQVDDWNGGRKDRARAGEYLEYIAADLESDITTIEDRAVFWKRVYDYGATGLRYAKNGHTGGASYWELLLAYFQASQVAEFVNSQATFDELKSAGELGLITDRDLRIRLINYYNFEGAVTLVERPAYRMHVRGIVPLEIQSYIWSNCYATDPDGSQRMLECEPPETDADIRSIVDGLAGNAALMEELQYWMSTMEVSQLIVEDRKAEASELLGIMRSASGGK